MKKALYAGILVLSSLWFGGAPPAVYADPG
jgi:hypothetical protein